MCAFGPEMKALVAEMNVEATDVLLGRTCYLGKLGEKNVAVLASGISEVNAAMMAQAAISGPSFMDNDNYRIFLWNSFKVEIVDREIVGHLAAHRGDLSGSARR